MLILVTGSRSWQARKVLRARLEKVGQEFDLMHGGAPGVDTIAGEEYFDLTRKKPIVVRPKYNKYYFKIAPKMRNVEMCELAEARQKAGEEVLVIGFKDLNSATGGTLHCIEAAKEHGLTVELIRAFAS